MSGVSFTEEQRAAIEARGCDLLVSAAAGSGKTAVLAERIVRLVSEGDPPCDIDRILVVTFTRAAAAGMRERIAAALSARIEAAPDSAHLRRQEVLLPHAKIMTIDAFCQYILRNNFEAVGLDPSFRVSDEGEMKLLMAQTLEEVLEECYQEAEGDKDSAFLRCVEAFSAGASDRAIEEEILKLYRFSESMPWPALWLRTQRKACAADSGAEGEYQWITNVTERVRREFLRAREELTEAMAVVRAPGGPWMYEETISDDIENIEALAACGSFWELHSRLYPSGLSFGRLPVKRDESVLPEKREAVREARNAVKALLKKNIDRYFSCSREEIALREARAAQALDELARLALRFGERLEQKKREKNLIDFSDMEHLALRVLAKEPASLAEPPEPTEIAGEYAAYFQEIMIDEYQDSNYVQETLLGAIAQKAASCRRFMVGDVKQSIYRFRLARPEIFMEKFARYARDGLAGERRIDLHRNFRSRGEVLALVNEVFARLMRADIGGVDYDEDAVLRPGASYPQAPEEGMFTPELLLLARDDAGEGGAEEFAEQEEAPGAGRAEEAEDFADEAALTDGQAEARMIAGRIRELVTSGAVSDGKGGLRRPRYGDIVILLRATAGVDEIYREVLTEDGIPVHIESKAGYFQAREVRALTDLLAVLENPLRDIPLAGVLHSVLGGFDEEELARIRACDGRRESRLYEALLCAAQDARENKISDDIITDALKEKCRAFLTRLFGWREAAGRLPVRGLLDEILAETDYMEQVAAMPAGERRRANVRMLLLRAADFERTGGHGLAAFSARLEQYRRVEVDYGEANALSEHADLVRIMSIHKSKGLEYPIVFVAGLARAFNRRDERAAVLADEGIGLGAYAVDLEKRVKHSSLKRLAIADKLQEDSLGEEYRVLYVAMTRAKEKLILTAGVKKEQAEDFLRAREAGEERLTARRRAHAASFADALLAALTGCRAPLAIRLCHRQDLRSGQRTEDRGVARREALLRSVDPNNIDSYLKTRIEKRLAYVYAHRALENLFVKTTVTELKERMLSEEEEGPGADRLYWSTEEAEIVPAFLRGEQKLIGAARGTAYHKVMELLDAEILAFDDITNPDLIIKNQNTVYEWMKKRESDRLPKGYADVVQPEDVLRFLCSALGGRFAAAFRAGALFREKQFMMSIDAARLNPENPDGETVLLQGVVDAFFIEEGQLVILDYKTDRVAGDGGELAEKYGVQLALYAEALGRIMELPVKEKWIWSFAKSRAIPV